MLAYDELQNNDTRMYIPGHDLLVAYMTLHQASHLVSPNHANFSLAES